MEYTRRAYGTKFVETVWVRIHANCRLKRVYFAEREMNDCIIDVNTGARALDDDSFDVIDQHDDPS